MELYKEFTFEAAHRLPNTPTEHKCSRVHGHTYRVEVRVRGAVDPHMGWVMDFADIKEAFRSIHDELDHSFLNEIEGLKNPTSEHLVRWIWWRLRPRLPGLSELILRETATSGCIYRGEDD